MRAAAAAAAFIMVAGTLSCGKKAPPFLPVPVAAGNLTVREVHVRGQEVTVTFRVPSEVFSFAGEEERWSRAQLLRRGAGENEFTVAGTTSPAGGFEFGSRAAVADGSALPGTAYQYRVELRKEESEEWAAAGPFEVTLAGLPDVTEAPRIDSREAALAVTWARPGQSPEAVEWVLVRREDGGAATAVSPAPLQAVSYVDTRVAPGRTYCYAVSPVISEGLVVLEGGRSPEACGATVDRTPPPPPSELIAVVEESGVRLSWLPSAAEDVAGYRVYRSEGSAPFVHVGSSPDGGTRYLDTDITPGVTYRYRVSAVDGPPSRNESPFSETVRTVITGQ